jgi:hypothetical protein
LKQAEFELSSFSALTQYSRKALVLYNKLCYIFVGRNSDNQEGKAIYEFWTHKKSGEVFAIEMDDHHHVTSCLGPLSYQKIREASRDGMRVMKWADGVKDAAWAEEHRDGFHPYLLGAREQEEQATGEHERRMGRPPIADEERRRDIHLMLEPHYIRQIATLARQRRMTRSALMRELIIGALEGASANDHDQKPGNYTSLTSSKAFSDSEAGNGLSASTPADNTILKRG